MTSESANLRAYVDRLLPTHKSRGWDVDRSETRIARLILGWAMICT